MGPFQGRPGGAATQRSNAQDMTEPGAPGDGAVGKREALWLFIAGVVILVVIGIVRTITATQQSEVSSAGNNAEVDTTAEIPEAQFTAEESEADATAQLPRLIGFKKYDSAPPMLIDQNKRYMATVTMKKGGKFVIELYPDKAPITVNSFVFLAREQYFDGIMFHRVLEGLMAQSGDPTGTGLGGPGYQFANEDSDLSFDKAGVIAMANAGRDTNGSQFFITFGPAEQLNGGYTIFGQVISGMEVVSGLRRRDPEQNPHFRGDVIATITITEQ